MRVSRSVAVRRWPVAFLVSMCLAAVVPTVAPGLPSSIQPVAPQEDQVAALKKSAQENTVRLHRYEWIETTAVSLNGEEKSRKQNRCYYGADGVQQKVPIASAAPQEAPKRGLRGRVIEKKKEEMTDYMHKAVALVHSYVPPDAELIEAAKSASKIAMRPIGGTYVAIEITDYRLTGDRVTIEFDRALSRIRAVKIATYLESPKDAISLEIQFSSLPDGTNHPHVITLDAPAKNIRVMVANTGYRIGS